MPYSLIVKFTSKLTFSVLWIVVFLYPASVSKIIQNHITEHSHEFSLNGKFYPDISSIFLFDDIVVRILRQNSQHQQNKCDIVIESLLISTKQNTQMKCCRMSYHWNAYGKSLSFSIGVEWTFVVVVVVDECESHTVCASYQYCKSKNINVYMFITISHWFNICVANMRSFLHTETVCVCTQDDSLIRRNHDCETFSCQYIPMYWWERVMRLYMASTVLRMIYQRNKKKFNNL